MAQLISLAFILFFLISESWGCNKNRIHYKFYYYSHESPTKPSITYGSSSGVRTSAYLQCARIYEWPNFHGRSTELGNDTSYLEFRPQSIKVFSGCSITLLDYFDREHTFNGNISILRGNSYVSSKCCRCRIVRTNPNSTHQSRPTTVRTYTTKPPWPPTSTTIPSIPTTSSTDSESITSTTISSTQYFPNATTKIPNTTPEPKTTVGDSEEYYGVEYEDDEITTTFAPSRTSPTISTSTIPKYTSTTKKPVSSEEYDLDDDYW